MFIWMPSWAAGPENAADWPSRIDFAVTPGTCAMVLSGTAQASREAIRSPVFMAECRNRGTLDFLLRLAGGHLQAPHAHGRLGFCFGGVGRALHPLRGGGRHDGFLPGSRRLLHLCICRGT